MVFDRWVNIKSAVNFPVMDLTTVPVQERLTIFPVNLWAGRLTRP